jgi:ATP-dependent Zn protease
MDNNQNKKPNGNNKLYYIALAILIIISIASILLINFINNKPKEDNNLAYTELIKEIDNKSIEKIEMTVGSTEIKVKQKDNDKEKKAIVPNTQAFIELIQEEVKNGNEIELIQNQTNIFLKISETLLQFLPTILIIILFIVILKMQGLGDKGKVYDAEKSENTHTTFKDVAGLDEEKE